MIPVNNSNNKIIGYVAFNSINKMAEDDDK
jgi:hypothetical protein